VELQGRVKALQDQGLGLAAVSYDSREVLAAFAKQNGITFPLLSDPGSATIRRYGILNTVVDEALGPNADDPRVRAEVEQYVSAANPRANMQGIPFPGTFVLDRQGRVTSRAFEDFYRERVTTSNVLARLGLNGGMVAGQQVATMHLELTTAPSDASVVPGNRFALVLDITPRPGMHVYAAGATAYRIITLSVAPQPFLRVLPLAYPPSEIYHFVPLDERVPAYQKPFRLSQEVVIDVDQKAQAALRGQEALTIAGALEYQACDDTICYNPVSLPLSWRVELRGNVPGLAR
jgi:peroxiredoxin